jgi:hypothetical protein
MAADMQAPQPPPVPESTTSSLDVAAVAPVLLAAIESCARKAMSDDSAAEVKDYGAAALAFAQTAITLDPSRLGAGATPAAQVNAMPPQAPPTPKLPPTKDGNRNGVIGG